MMIKVPLFRLNLAPIATAFELHQVPLDTPTPKSKRQTNLKSNQMIKPLGLKLLCRHQKSRFLRHLADTHNSLKRCRTESLRGATVL